MREEKIETYMAEPAASFLINMPLRHGEGDLTRTQAGLGVMPAMH